VGGKGDRQLFKFSQRPVSATLLIMAAVLLALIVLPQFRRTRSAVA
jgi:hypothetical protein